jgi:hypothetical protein
MNMLIQTTLLGCLLALTACTKSYEPPTEEVFKRQDEIRQKMKLAPMLASVACADCSWDAVVGKEGPVSYVGCVNEAGEPEHCHLTVSASDPRRTAVITKVGGRYHFSLKSAKKESGGMQCDNLALAPNPLIIYTKDELCVVTEPGIKGGEKHHFGAKLEKLADGSRLVRFVFQHKAFNDKGDPIHNGEGHIHPPN